MKDTNLSNSTGWVPLHLQQKALFPMHVFPRWLQDLITMLALLFGTYPDYAATAALAIVSAALVGRVAIQIAPLHQIRIQIYCCIVGRSSGGKSPVVNLLSKPLLQKNMEINKRIERENALRKEKLQQIKFEKSKLRRSNLPNEEERISLQLLLKEEKRNKPFALFETLPTDTSPEGFRDKLIEQGGCGIILSPESQLLVMLLDQPGGIVKPSASLFLHGFDGERAEIVRASRGKIVFDSTNIAIVTGAQVEIAQKFVNNAPLNDVGLIGRFLFCYPGTSIIAPELTELPDNEPLLLWNQLIKTLTSSYRSTDIANNPFVMQCTPDAMAYLHEISRKYRCESNTTYSDIASYAGKANILHAKIAGILALIKNPAASSITIEDVVDAGDVYDYYLAHFRDITGSSFLREEEKVVMKSFIRYARKNNGIATEMGPLSFIKEQNRFRNDEGKKYYRDIVHRLQLKGLIRSINDGQVLGRATTRYIIHPEILALNDFDLL